MKLETDGKLQLPDDLQVEQTQLINDMLDLLRRHNLALLQMIERVHERCRDCATLERICDQCGAQRRWIIKASIEMEQLRLREYDVIDRITQYVEKRAGEDREPNA